MVSARTLVSWFVGLAAAACVLADDPDDLAHKLLVPCAVEDIPCLRKSTEKFLSQTAAGIPQYDILPIDPIMIPEMDQDLGVLYGIKHKLKELTVTGLKNQLISDFKMDLAAKTVLLIVTANINVAGKLTVEYLKQNKAFSGTYSSNGNVQVTTSYPYDVKKGDDGIDHFVVGKETIQCEALDVPKYAVNKELMAELDSHPDIAEARARFHANAGNLMKASMCDLVQKTYPTVVHNIRASAKVLPKTAYFKNL